MCGIAGYAGFNEPGLIARMCDALTHRGPDSQGRIELPENRMALGMRRLAVIDLQTGDQPMSAAAGDVQLVYNGELYNFRELRKELQQLGHQFATSSDTEVILHAYLEWGSNAWTRLQGMFTIAIADLRDTPCLRLVRDRVGIKPLYYSLVGDQLIFASEMKALLEHSRLTKQVSLNAISDYLALRYVPGPATLFDSVRKMPAGHEMVFRRGDVDLSPWWTSPPFENQDPAQTIDEAAKDLGGALRTAVQRHMISDVPVGAFLSGGIDSNVIVALMAEHASQPVQTFSIGFPGEPGDELQRAAVTARAFGTNHSEIECTTQDFANLSDIAWSLDEPIGDPIVVPMYVLAREARKVATVVLSGEGADEMLGGYLFHRKIMDLYRWQQRLPAWAWSAAASIAGRVPSSILDMAFDYPGRLGDSGRDKLKHLLGATSHGDLADLYRVSVSLFDTADIEAASGGRLPRASVPARSAPDGTPLQRLLDLQFADWLPDDILMKTDKITMANSLECRVPFMDELVINAASRASDTAKLSGGQTKVALRRFAETILPDEIVKAPKKAFYAPLAPYMNEGPLADMMAYALDPSRLRRRGLIDPSYVAALKAGGPKAGFIPEKQLFSILMLELWFDRFAPDASWA